MAVGERGERRHLGDQPDRRHVALLRVVDALGVGVEGREGADAREQHAHRVGVVAEGLEEVLDVLVDEGVVGDVEDPPLELLLGRQLAEDQQVRHLEIARVLAELLDRDPAVLEDALLAVDERDRRAARRGVRERRVVGHEAEVVVGDLDLAEVHRPDGPVRDLHLVGLAGAAVGDGQRVGVSGRDVAVLGLSLLFGRHRPLLYVKFFLSHAFSQLARIYPMSRRAIAARPTTTISARSRGWESLRP